MTDKEVLIIDGVIKGILAFLSNPKNKEIKDFLLKKQDTDWSTYYQFLIDRMDAIAWLEKAYRNSNDLFFNGDHWQQCVDHALMILQKEYDYEQS